MANKVRLYEFAVSLYGQLINLSVYFILNKSIGISEFTK